MKVTRVWKFAATTLLLSTFCGFASAAASESKNEWLDANDEHRPWAWAVTSDKTSYYVHRVDPGLVYVLVADWRNMAKSRLMWGAITGCADGAGRYDLSGDLDGMGTRDIKGEWSENGNKVMDYVASRYCALVREAGQKSPALQPKSGRGK
jgi:hypothetical protein